MPMLVEIHPTNGQLSSAELCLSAQISSQTLLLLVEHEIAVPITGAEPPQWIFHLSAVTKVQKATRLHSDLEIDWADLSLVLQLLDDIEQLTHENNQLKQRIARFGQSE